MKGDLQALLAAVRQSGGIAHKRDIQLVADALREAWPRHAHPNGDDCAQIDTAGGVSLLAMEGFINSFVAQDPWFAGWCGVMVNLSDIAAMGGRPQAIVNALWSARDDQAQQILQGMAAASRAYQVPIVGGHTNLRSNQSQLAVAVLGHARRVLNSFAVRPGLTLVVAINLAGRWHPPGLNWDAATDADPAALRRALAILPALAETQQAVAAKDISQAGLLGTLVMMMESARLGVSLDLNAIPRPDECDWQDWLCAFPSFGFLLAVEPQRVDAAIARFDEAGINAAAVGAFDDSRRLTVYRDGEHACFWDLNTAPLTGMGR
ncbi:sll0787 family AIR synthase-like protein [Affinibrenneria salicis]|uniref:Sll0787 family AIR synthase-like protein n=1 Tax=Affinibrenneria salicis TaxID=2590031 RepID=A0A5J5G1T2_9GAMM|nr:sll0787 family AIR synthase-like protein [Affinibrenneria salicis]KAA9000529.1 sll0787 family AIR synthase-like protein [Affinibrenneria salicis]